MNAITCDPIWAYNRKCMQPPAVDMIDIVQYYCYNECLTESSLIGQQDVAYLERATAEMRPHHLQKLDVVVLLVSESLGL